MHGLKAQKETRTLNFMWCVKCSVLNYAYVMLFIKSHTRTSFRLSDLEILGSTICVMALQWVGVIEGRGLRFHGFKLWLHFLSV